MQTAVKIFDFSAQGNFGPIDKVAIRLSGRSDAVNRRAAADFMEMIKTMMRLDPEQVRASPDQFEKAAIEGEAPGGLASLIDLSGKQEDRPDWLGLLLGRSRGRAEGLEMDDGDESEDGHCRCDNMPFEGPVPMDMAAGRMIRPELQPIVRAPVTGTGEAAKNPKPNVLIPPVSNLESPSAMDPPDESEKAMDLNAPQRVNPPNVPSGVMAGAAGKNPATPQAVAKEAVAKEAVVKAANDPAAVKSVLETAGKVEPGLQELAADEITRRSGQVQRKNSPSVKPEIAKLMPAPAPRSTAVSPMEPARGEKMRVAPEPVQTAPQIFNTEVGEGTAEAAKSAVNQGDVQQRAPVGRDGFQNMMARLGGNGAQPTESVPADRTMNEPSRQLQNDVMRQIVQRMALRTQGAQSRMQIHLKPEFLGNVHMQISTENQQVAVRMTAESMAVKEMIEQHLSFLKAELHHHGLEIDKFDVQVGNDSEGWKSSQDPSGFRQALKNGQGHRMGRHRRESSEKDDVDSRPAAAEKSESTSEIDYFA